jgi:hypothetical protein
VRQWFIMYQGEPLVGSNHDTRKECIELFVEHIHGDRGKDFDEEVWILNQSENYKCQEFELNPVEVIR